ncbi:uncharacterized protein N7506_000300 [Penicillium brevicompactum]|uniref:uncharacterized protein n=1 Tax=Penicillium brevicompactum TaxID=5074 RepID=UPI0025418F25|nr:uncharacterized protein N7506_000300 [Penicillium brevicompactum]KAJ5347047.1 hypothetical protein N7506_000300 [Penicillium brevicompactum]
MAGRTYQPATYDTAPRKEQASVSLVSKNDDAHVGYVLPQRLNTTGVPEQDSYAHKYSSLANSTSRSGGMNLHLAASPRRPRWTMPAVLLTPDSVQVFVQYYARELSTAFYLGNGPARTPYTQYILPMTKSVPCIRYAVGATASCHIGNRLQDKKLKMQSLQLRLDATQALRQQLRNDIEETDISSIACMVLLAQLDLCSGDCLEFGTHLKAASEIVKRHGSDGTEQGFFQQRLAWLDIMGSTTSSRMIQMNPEHIKAALNKFKNPSGRRWGFDVFDCPIDLFECIADITVLHKVYMSPKISSDVALKEAIILGNAVRTWTGSDILSNQRGDMVEIWRRGILLYLARIFQLPDETFDTSHLLESVFRRAERLSSKTNRKFSTSWPLFQAGLCLDQKSHERKQWLRKEFATHFATLGCCNPKLAIDVLEQFWQTGDAQILDSQTLLF